MARVETDATEVDALSSIDTLIARPLALMTAWADRRPQARPELRRSLAQAPARWARLPRPEQLGGMALVAAGAHALH